jgi:hypothetical protein
MVNSHSFLPTDMGNFETRIFLSFSSLFPSSLFITQLAYLSSTLASLFFTILLSVSYTYRRWQVATLYSTHQNASGIYHTNRTKTEVTYWLEDKKEAVSPFALTLLHCFQAQRSIILINNVCTCYY